jgi:Uma2 family endonuclease
MSEQEFINWDHEGIRAEWVDGKVEFMNAVAGDHADLTAFIHLLVGGFVMENELGKVWFEPFELRLPKQKRRRSPDLFYACKDRLHLFEKTQFNGAADLVVEVVSPDSKKRDRQVKFLEYQEAGVREYWLPDPVARTFEAYTVGSSGTFEPIPPEGGKMNSIVLPGLYFREEWVWQLKFPKTAALIAEMSRIRKRTRSRKR